MITIKDIAQKAGVSVATVSKVLNNYPDVSQKTKDKVARVIKEYNFRPNAVARSLTTQKSYTVGIFFTDHFNSGLQHPFFHEVIFGMEKALGDHGYDLLYFADRKWGENFSYREKCQNRQVDGVVLIGVARDDPNLEDLLKSDLPVVFIDLDIRGPKASYVMSDNTGGAAEAVRYLHRLGHTKIGMIMGLTSTKTTQDRLEGFQLAFRELNLTCDPEWLVNGEYTEEGGYRAMRHLLQKKERPTAIFCQSDLMAIGAIRAIEEAGGKVPDDFSIIGFDDIEVSRYLRPGLTTMRQDKMAMGRSAAELILQMIHEPQSNFRPVILPVEVVERESCRCRQ
ncbi:LacI family DNA-binding transcriptional regulator [Capillibacterium thermochitinicola]|uniref:LacI family DNA-binding transcriptional regulator n=1 Tax=Capillibacterium thermochitinicola TaxID=2699427 RepID=A0A8J6I0J4_9FIRM|nr:LacI family DNA-binding transcriptional regulator [Capillibacterium thermochitinicola]MBA2133395.1 LacI family DNA-binding transcriptional regulator [Capillibacterium thermochitinicola]